METVRRVRLGEFAFKEGLCGLYALFGLMV